MGKSAPRENGAEQAAFTPRMMREYSAGLAESARLQAQGEADAMAIRAEGEARARRTRADADADATRAMQGVHRAAAPTSSLSVRSGPLAVLFKGPTVALVAAAVLGVTGLVAYEALGSGAGTRDTGGGNPSSGRAGSAASADVSTGSSGASSPSVAAVPPDQGATTPAAAQVREQRKVVMSIGSNTDLDFRDSLPDISLNAPDSGDKFALRGYSGSEIADVTGEATAASCAAATDYGFVITDRNIRRGLTACVLTNENRVAAIRVLGWQKNTSGLSSVTLSVTTWEKTEDTA
ncbi:hypothetical protein ABZT17_18875 [Streptomyces sp. NPDC005648]|uniref:hypothetical protein n=1 Tax=Streptomyces sp. NPDC005648 TaxID=3157044 RepID=UPI0033B0A0FF